MLIIHEPVCSLIRPVYQTRSAFSLAAATAARQVQVCVVPGPPLDLPLSNSQQRLKIFVTLPTLPSCKLFSYICYMLEVGGYSQCYPPGVKIVHIKTCYVKSQFTCLRT